MDAKEAEMTLDKVTLEQIMEAVAVDDCRGFCLACGAEASGVEPDARNYVCEACDEPQVFGAEELLFMVS
jgi:hypothetical protein